MSIKKYLHRFVEKKSFNSGKKDKFIAAESHIIETDNPNWVREAAKELIHMALPCQKQCSQYREGCHKTCVQWKMFQKNQALKRQKEKAFLREYREIYAQLERQWYQLSKSV